MVEQGLSIGEINKRRVIFGKNEISERETAPAWQLFFSQVPTLINGILLVGALLSYLLNDTFLWLECYIQVSEAHMASIKT